MRLLLILFTFAAAIFGSPPAMAASGLRVLLVVSGHGREQGQAQPGFEYDEFAQAWTVLRDNGVTIEVASPDGGTVEPDRFDPDKIYNRRTLADPQAARWLTRSLSTKRLDARRYAGIFVLGGGGAMFDLWEDRALLRLLEQVHEQGGVIGGVCHGPALFAKLRDRDGNPLVSGRRLTGFTNAEERLFGRRWSSRYPMLLEDALRSAGAAFAEAEPMLPFAVRDARIVTGQNPYSTALAVEEMLRALGREPAPRTSYPDERSLTLVARFLRGEAPDAAAQLAADPSAFDIPLIGIWGHYRARQAGTDRAKLEGALAIMALAAGNGPNPRLELSMAEAEIGLGRKTEARSRLTPLIEHEAHRAAAERLLETIGE